MARLVSLTYGMRIIDLRGTRLENETKSIPRDLRRFFVPGYVLQVEAVVFEASGVIVVSVIVIGFLSRFWSRCTSSGQSRRGRERSRGSADVGASTGSSRRLWRPLRIRVEVIRIVRGSRRDPSVQTKNGILGESRLVFGSVGCCSCSRNVSLRVNNCR